MRFRRHAPRVRAAGHPGDEHRRLRLARSRRTSNPLRGAGFEGIDRAIWFFNHLVFEAKMMTIFSMLFGAGLVLMNDRASARGASLRGVYYRRVLWLLVIGAIHAYLIWDGDILVLYAECGLFLYLFRNKTPRTLIIVGVAFMMLIVPLVLGLRRGHRRHEGGHGAGRRPGQGRRDAQPSSTRRIRDLWTDHLQEEFKPNPEQKAKHWNEAMAVHRGGYLGHRQAPRLGPAHGADHRLPSGRVLLRRGRMLLGMGLMKLGVFSAERSRRSTPGWSPSVTASACR